MSQSPALYNETFQNRTAPPTAYESLLGDCIERACAAGIHDLDGVVGYLTDAGPSGPNGQPWTAATFQQEMARLGA